ncbi:unnamed protein product [Caenorhabditis auriculariae]|uniref:Uncharacterized protein n=1 Tax=Caenorhabditis auriculariae TaxID=2777116 RepID=A0A8S1HWX2_9PELO|nr:unnamed protein product [Caenorhabditis auriculariae]
MGQLLAFFRKPTLDAVRVRRVWVERINSHEKYIQEVLIRICARNEAIKATMLATCQQHAVSESEQNFFLSTLADRIVNFFHHLISPMSSANSAPAIGSSESRRRAQPVRRLLPPPKAPDAVHPFAVPETPVNEKMFDFPSSGDNSTS